MEEDSTQENQIFLYMRIRDDKRTLYKSRIREFMAIYKTSVEFMKEVWKKFGYDVLKNCALEYVDANSEMILISIRKDLVRGLWIISGLIPKEYQSKMLDEQWTHTHATARDFLWQMTSIFGPDKDYLIRQRIVQPVSGNIVSLIRNHIQATGEFYFEALLQPLPQG